MIRSADARHRFRIGQVQALAGRLAVVTLLQRTIALPVLDDGVVPTLAIGSSGPFARGSMQGPARYPGYPIEIEHRVVAA